MRLKLRYKVLAVFALVIGIWFYNCLPEPLFNQPTSTVIESNRGELLGAMIATDGQWRFPLRDSMPVKYIKAVTAFEDQYFYYHPGFNPISMSKAIIKNIKVGRVVGGGSTITQQTIRLSRGNPGRTIIEKLYELILAVRLELKYSKNEILSYYASNAPFGGNVVGIDAASWRYFGRSPDRLSWSESATLAVLPNAPSLIHPGKNRQLLIEKRNRLLDKLYRLGYIDTTSLQLAKAEPLPNKPAALPQLAPHLLTRVYNETPGERVVTSIDKVLQQRVNKVVNKHYKNLSANKVYNAAALIIDVESGSIIAYTGNTNCDPSHNKDVDVIPAQRSTGSILKPILYAASIDEGTLLPNMLLPDIPVNMAGYTPKNFDYKYSGAVPAYKALYRSLNVPAVFLLQKYGLGKFHSLLQNLNLSGVSYSANHYGLSLILGGAEASLWDLCAMYGGFARTLNHYASDNSMYRPSDYRPATYRLINDKLIEKPVLEECGIISAGALWHTFKAMQEVNRPEQERGWRHFSSTNKIAWKTGTSFGFRDGWAIGITPQYVIGVWVGNADGEGRPGLTGVSAAAPILFEIFDYLPKNDWFDKPYDDMVELTVCAKSGYKASTLCASVDTILVPIKGVLAQVCPYEQLVHLDKTGNHRVASYCASISEMEHKSWFVLPPIMEWFYKKSNPVYQTLPPYRADCKNLNTDAPMDFIYPKTYSKVYVPLTLAGERGEVVFEIAHRKPSTKVYWHLDDKFLGSTEGIHQMGLQPSEGNHTITLVDNNGNTISNQFLAIGKN